MQNNRNYLKNETMPQHGVLRNAFSYFLRIRIAGKMLVGYISMLALIFIISVFALIHLDQLNRINKSILQTDVPVLEASDKMIEALLAQELYAQRYVILRTSEILKLFWERSEEFNQVLESILKLPNTQHFPIIRLQALHQEYERILIRGMDYIGNPTSSFSNDIENKIKAQQENIISVIKKMTASAQKEVNQKTAQTSAIGGTAFKLVAFFCGAGFIFSVAATFLITRNISGAIKKLKSATQKISEGDFDHRPKIQNKDELGDLAQAFVMMAERLKQLEERFLDTNPLTRLPGGVTIENMLKQRVDNALPLAFGLVDVDNFKSYNDRYGYAKGNDFLKTTALIIEEAVNKCGSGDDFVGHIGGDDFVFITSPDHFEPICKYIIECFDNTIPEFYDPTDRKRGHILGENRQGQKVAFPIATISIAVVTNQKRKIDNHIRIGEIAAEIKEHAKSLPQSIYVSDQRSKSADKSAPDNNLIMFKKSKPGKKS